MIADYRKRSRIFLAVFLVPIALGIIPGVMNVRFLDRTGELIDANEMAIRQQEDDGLFGTAVHHNDYRYKIAIAAVRQPEIVVVGSSRVLQFRQSHFSRPFANLGRTVGFSREVSKLAVDLKEVASPKLVLLGIDFWWANPAFIPAHNFVHHDWRGGDISPRVLMAPTKWLLESKLTAQEYWEILSSGSQPMINSRPAYGVQATKVGKGYGADGSHYYSGTVYGRRPPEDPTFSDTLRRIQLGGSQFRHAATVDHTRIDNLFAAIEAFRERGAEVITFLPPLAPTVFAAMTSAGDDYAYVTQFRSALKSLDVPFFDFHNPASVGTTDCEFVDGFHGGAVANARMLREMLKRGAPALVAYIDEGRLSRMIEEYAGKVQVDDRYARDGDDEIDFLEIGCNK